jgi:hypothetical protein
MLYDMVVDALSRLSFWYLAAAWLLAISHLQDFNYYAYTFYVSTLYFDLALGHLASSRLHLLCLHFLCFDLALGHLASSRLHLLCLHLSDLAGPPLRHSLLNTFKTSSTMLTLSTFRPGSWPSRVIKTSSTMLTFWRSRRLTMRSYGAAIILSRGLISHEVYLPYYLLISRCSL